MVAISTNKIFCQITKIAFSLSCIFENVFFVRLFHIFLLFCSAAAKNFQIVTSRVDSTELCRL